MGSEADTANNETVTDVTTEAEKKEPNIWVRGLIMAFYVVITRVVELVVVAVLVTQFLFKLMTKKTNQRLTDFGEALSLYIASIVRYQTFNTEERPFPFGAWPKVERASADKDESNDSVPPTQPQAS